MCFAPSGDFGSSVLPLSLWTLCWDVCEMTQRNKQSRQDLHGASTMLAMSGAGSTRGFHRHPTKTPKRRDKSASDALLEFFLFLIFFFREIRAVFQQSQSFSMFSPKQTQSRCVLKGFWLGEHREVHMGFPVRVCTSWARVCSCQCTFCCSLQREQAQLCSHGIP